MKMYEKRRDMMAVLFAILLLGGTSAQAQPGSAVPDSLPELRLSLREAMAAAVDNNPNVRLLKERIETARAANKTQLGALLPNLSTNVRQTRQNIFLGTIGLAPVRTDPFSIFDARVNVSQSLFSLSLIQRWRASREALKVAELESETTKFDTMSAVGLLYIETLKAEATVNTRNANMQLFQELLELARSRRGGGMGTGLDTARLEAQLENERQQLAAARYEVERLKVNILHGLGFAFDVRLTLSDELKLEVLEPPTIDEALTVAMNQRMEVKAQQQRIKTAALTLNSAETERIPSLAAQGDYGLIGNRMHNTLDTYNIGLFLTVPLFDGAREGRISESRSQVNQETIRMRVVSNQVVLDVREALVTLLSAKEQLAISQVGLQAALKEVALAKERFTVLSAGSNFEVTNALYSLSRARDNTVDAMFRLNGARVNLARALGELDKLS
ncbi:MAG: TolC family protein [Nitrospira sp.]|mgnify:FL=1|nr:TolC family protein [Nitrospira sp.]